MTQEEIEIPFGAKDSELKGWEYTIPENMEAEIRDGKIIVKQKESEDERIRKVLIQLVQDAWDGRETAVVSDERVYNACLAWLEKQQEPYYTKRNELFDKCVENCDPKTVEEVNKRVDDIMNMSELSAFEQALTNFIGDWEDDEERWPSKFVKKRGKHILDMAREELEKEQKPIITGTPFNPDGYETVAEDNATSLIRKEQKPAECLKAERDGWYVCTKDYYRGGKKQCSVGDLVQAKGGMYIMGEEDISEWFRRAYYEEVRDALGPNDDTNIPKQELSEEDEDMILNIISSLRGYMCSGSKNYNNHEALIQKEIEFLNSIYPYWKPSEEQMKALASCLPVIKGTGDAVSHILESLYNDLKKLK